MTHASLSERARAGDVRAMTAWGRALVTGEDGGPISVASMREGLGYLRDAADRSDPEAPAVLAMMAACGMLQPRDLGAAITLLNTSAQRGWAPAQNQLEVLAGRSVEALRKPANVRVFAEKPRVRVVEGFATPAECDWVIECARAHLERAEVYQGSTDLEVSDVRTNTEAYLTPKLLDVVSAVVLQRAANVLRLDTALFEFATVLHYEPGQLFGPHDDFFDPGIPSQRAEILARGQRIATFLLYLNDDYDGGETAFLDADLKYKGRKGDAMFFINVEPTGRADVLTRHQGSPPTRGEKWVLSQWVRSNPVNAYLTPGAERVSLPAPWLRDV